MTDLYLDIETDGGSVITVIGLVEEGREVIQLVGEEVTRANLLDCIPRSGRIFTFNGERFDLPKIRNAIGVDLRSMYQSCDLMKVGWAHDRAGGQKSIEDQLGFNRSLPGMGGLDAIRLWREYSGGSPEALETLLAYNAEDLEGMRYIRGVFEKSCCISTHNDRNSRIGRFRRGERVAAS